MTALNTMVLYVILLHTVTVLCAVCHLPEAEGRNVLNDKRKSTTESVKDEDIQSVKYPTNKLPLMINQALVSRSKVQSVTLNLPLNTSSPKNYLKAKARNRIMYKHTQSFQPCNTCKLIVERRKKMFVKFKSTSTEAVNTIESQNITQATALDKTCSGGDTTNDKQSKNVYNLCNEKSDLVKSKERIEELLQVKRKQLYCLVR